MLRLLWDLKFNKNLDNNKPDIIVFENIQDHVLLSVSPARLTPGCRAR